MSEKYRFLETDRSELLYQMHKIVERVNNGYSTDFTCHDIPNLVLNDFKPCIWGPRTYGTEMFWCEDVTDESEWLKKVVNYHNNNSSGIEWYYWNGQELTPTTADEILSGKFWEIKKEELING